MTVNFLFKAELLRDDEKNKTRREKIKDED